MVHRLATPNTTRSVSCWLQIERTESEQQEFALWKEAQASQLAEQLAAMRSEHATALQRCLEAAVRLHAHIAETAAILVEWEDSALGDALGPPGAGPAAAMSAEEEEAAALAQDAQMELVDKRAQVGAGNGRYQVVFGMLSESWV